MKYSFVAAALAVSSYAAPAKRQSTNIDATVLQFALTLEHLENVFYKGALQKFTQTDFLKAGYSTNYYNNLKYIASDEEDHVKFLTTALTAAGATPVAACTYNFPYTDVDSFITLSSVLEGVGTSAYLGGAPLITSKAYLTAAGSILVTEALHTSLQRGAVNSIPFATPYGTPLDPTSVFTLAAAFIKSCPSTNAALPFVPFPALTLNTAGGTLEQPSVYFNKKRQSTAGQPWGANDLGQPRPQVSGSKGVAATAQGANVMFTSAAALPANSYITFVSGLNVISVKASTSGNSSLSAAVPNTVAGQVYALLTNAPAANNTLVSTTIVAGPAILEIAPSAPVITYSQA